MDLDISAYLNDWPFEPGKVTVRKIVGQDGQDKIQLRLDLGLLQMDMRGRPDGQRPNGCESLLAYHEQRLKRHKADYGNDKNFELDEQACEMLRAEAVMYYHRYLACFVLEEYEVVERDTLRNLRVMDICNSYAADKSDQYVMEQYRPYVLMMHTRARVHVALHERRSKAALTAVRLGIEKIRDFYSHYGSQNLAEESAELAILRALAKEIAAHIPIDPLTKLRRRLHRAVAEERYESAAKLRDQIHTYRATTPPGNHVDQDEGQAGSDRD